MGRKSESTVLSGFTGVINNLLRSNVTNSEVLFEQLCKLGYTGGMTTVKNHILAHKDLIPLLAFAWISHRQFTDKNKKLVQEKWPETQSLET